MGPPSPLALLEDWGTVLGLLALLSVLLGFLTIPLVLAAPKSPQAKTAWILVLLGWPWIGLLFFWTFGRNRLKRRVLQLRDVRAAQMAGVERLEREQLRDHIPMDDLSQDLVREAVVGGGRAPYPGNDFLLLSEGEEAFARGLEAIEAARHHVHLATYIFRSDRTGRGVLDSLVAAAARGVKVRVLYDAFGSIWTPRRFFRPIVAAGGEVAAFLPLGRPTQFLRINLRNHRKILIADGRTAFLGGMNIGDEYSSNKEWHDIHCRIRGPAVAGLQRVFLEDWNFATGQILEEPAYFREARRRGDVPVQVVPGGPDQDEPLVEGVIFSAIAGARERIDIVSPYFVPPESIEAALRSALLRGRRVRLLIGRYVDHRIVRWAAEAVIPSLMRLGLEVWLHPGMIHGKLLVVDDEWATLGTTNIDTRSLRLNFEVNLAFPHAETARALRRHVDRKIGESQEATPADYDFSTGGWLLRRAAGLFSPIL